MKIPVSWLREFIDFPWDATELSRRLTSAGFEVEGKEPAAPPFTGVVVAEITGIAPHPEADKLRVCQVNAGGSSLQIVCGAANAREGLKAPLAMVGALLPGDLKIKAAKLRGMDSAGMLCSAKELGLAASSNGLLELPADAPVGQDIREYLKLDDVALELKIYANRGDAMSVLGVAREVGALKGVAVAAAQITASSVSASVPAATARVEAPQAAPRLLTRCLTGLDNTRATPLWMQERLRRAGLRSINPVVDVTNYVLIELGQPMHAYDARQLQGALCVRLARAGEKLTLLDERVIEPAADELLIADDSGPIGLAGIMGGQGTGVAPETTDVLLEVAYFSPDAVAGRARRHGLATDASQRFERGVNPQGQRQAIERATAILLDLCGGAAGAVHEVFDEAAMPSRAPVRLRRERLALLSGANIEDQRVHEVLSSLGMKVELAPWGWTVTPPGWRFDVQIEADLIEEILRLVGFEAVQEQPKQLPQRFRRHPENRPDERAVLDVLCGRGYQEAISYAFVDPALQQRLFPSQRAIALANPIASDLSVMRVSLWPALLKAAGENLSRQQDRVRLFELGRVFLPEAGNVREVPRVAGVICGSRLPEQWGAARAPSDFFDLKADVEAILSLAGPAAGYEWQSGGLECLHPGRSATVLRNGKAVGWLGELHPALAADMGLAGCQLFELDITPAIDASLPLVSAISRFPQVRRDLSITVPESTPLSAVRTRASVAAGSLLRELRVFDIYQGPGIESTRKSIALGLIFQDNNKTLKDDEADALMASVAADLGEKLGAKVRE